MLAALPFVAVGGSVIYLVGMAVYVIKAGGCCDKRKESTSGSSDILSKIELNGIYGTEKDKSKILLAASAH